MIFMLACYCSFFLHSVGVSGRAQGGESDGCLHRIPFLPHRLDRLLFIFFLSQLVSVAVLWAVKATVASIGFPFFLIVLIAVRIWIIPKIFTEDEIEELDNELDDNHFLVDEDEDE